MLDFTGKKVVVSGGSRGIGRAIARTFAARGASVCVSGRDEQSLAETQREIAAAGGHAHVSVCDLSDEFALARFIPAAANALGGIDVLINNASAFGRENSEHGWAAACQVDLMGTVRCSAAAVPFMVERGGGAIVNISSVSAFHPTPRAAPYGAIKAAIVHYTTSQAFELAAKNIRVNSVAPGAVEFPGHFWMARKEAGDPSYHDTVAKIPFGRLGVPDEIADVVMFLASPLARWVVGQTIIVDGGQELSY